MIDHECIRVVLNLEHNNSRGRCVVKTGFTGVEKYALV